MAFDIVTAVHHVVKSNDALSRQLQQRNGCLTVVKGRGGGDRRQRNTTIRPNDMLDFQPIQYSMLPLEFVLAPLSQTRGSSDRPSEALCFSCLSVRFSSAGGRISPFLGRPIRFLGRGSGLILAVAFSRASTAVESMLPCIMHLSPMYFSTKLTGERGRQVPEIASYRRWNEREENVRPRSEPTSRYRSRTTAAIQDLTAATPINAAVVGTL